MIKQKIFLLAFLLSVAGWAETYELDLFDRASGVQQMGAGYAGIARTNNPSPLHWNPAVLAIATQPSVELTAYRELEALDYLSLDMQYNSPRTIPYGLSYTSQIINDIPLTSSQGSLPSYEGQYADTYRALAMGAAYKLDQDLAVGATYKYINRSIYTYGAQGYGLDVGLIRKLSRSTNFGFVFKNISSGVNWSTGFFEKLERKIIIGVSSLDYFLKNKVMLDVDYEINPDLPEKNSWYFGSEWWLVANTFAFRLGTNINKELTCGMGLRMNDYRLDFAYIIKDSSTQLKNSLLFSSGYNFKAVLDSGSTAAAASDTPSDLTAKDTEKLAVGSKVMDDVIDQIVTSNEQVVIKFVGFDRINQVALVNPDKDVSYFVPTEKGLIIFPRKMLGDYTLYIQYKDEKIIKKRISL